jgi:hypothetical protein
VRAHALLSAFEHSAEGQGHGVVLVDANGIVDVFGRVGQLLSRFFARGCAHVLPDELARWTRAQRQRAGPCASALVRDGGSAGSRSGSSQEGHGEATRCCTRSVRVSACRTPA